MNDDRQIAAESRQIFMFCSLKLWRYCTILHQNFTRFRGISVAINPCIYKTMLHFVAFCLEMPEQRVKMVNFDVCKKVPKLIGYHSNVSSTTAKIFQFYNLHTWAYRCWNVDEVWSSICWDIWYDMLIFAVSSQKVQKLPARSLGLVDFASPKLQRM